MSAREGAGAEAHSPASPNQLTLLQVGAPEWRLDRRTCEIGRLGVAAAREVLQRAGADHRQRGRPAEAA